MFAILHPLALVLWYLHFYENFYLNQYESLLI